ncbi:hypothetical protein CI238_05230 [Colletotrichum incanum]|uniref:Azaphilone pigments biosynthesis cluster protein L N-terminal domain-containing protein n=1 Tax=Colletotrichum incanum TaxID=1573173 RepID=A0A167E093_COLIC|nr:hypothetical protein CI238_05230 [Colletotrichum incanum]OHX01171.1 hypothetical protein CSPAE12_00220 [Colletotrichum incanum]
MDPLTIVTAAASLAGVVLKASFKIKDTIDAYDDAPQNISDLAEEVQAVQIALRQVESVVLHDPEAIQRLGLEDVFTVAVNGCHATLLSISKEYEDLFLRSDWKAKIKALWKDGEMTRLLGRLDRKKATLTLLTQTLNLRSTQDIKTLLIEKQSTLNAAKQDVKEPAAYYPDFRPTSPDSLDEGSVVGIPRNRDSVLSTTEFDFDFDLINTKTYRRALQRYAVASQTADSAPEQGTECMPAFKQTLDPLLEERDNIGDLIEFPSDTSTFQPPSSQATITCPDLVGVDLDVPPATPPKEAVVRKERPGVNSPKIGLAPQTLETPDDTMAQNQFSKKLGKRSPRHLTAELTAERHHRRRKHGKPASLETCPSSQTPTISPSTRTSADSASSSCMIDSTAASMSAADQPDNKFEKLAHRRKCGRPVHHRRRHGKEELYKRNSEESTTTLSSVDSVTEALEQLGLPAPRTFGRERARRKQPG